MKIGCLHLTEENMIKDNYNSFISTRDKYAHTCIRFDFFVW